MPALAELERRVARSALRFRRSSRHRDALRATTSGVRRRCIAPRAWASSPGTCCLSNARISTTPARTRSTMRWAKRCSRCAWGKTRIIAETGAGQHGVAAATVGALLDLDCVVYMGTEDMRRQRPNVERMGLLGAERRAGRGRGADAQGGGLGGDPRLGHERRDDPLHHRLVRRPGAVPGARARPPAGDRRRGSRPGARARRPAARRA